MTFEQALREGADALGLDVSNAAVAGARDFADLLVRWSKRMDLTTVLDPVGMAERHFLDSWMGARHFPEGTRLLDAGSGAGFPGLALAILRPDLEVTSVESRTKKCVFQRTVVRELGLSHVDVRQARVEDLEATWPAVTARALAPLIDLLPLLAPRVQVGGTLLAYKGPGVEGELEGAGQVISELGFVQGEGEPPYRLPFSETTRVLLPLRKRGERFT